MDTNDCTRHLLRLTSLEFERLVICLAVLPPSLIASCKRKVTRSFVNLLGSFFVTILPASIGYQSFNNVFSYFESREPEKESFVFFSVSLASISQINTITTPHTYARIRHCSARACTSLHWPRGQK